MDTVEKQQRVRQVIAILQQRYGRPVWAPRLPALDELIACILSQHTSDRNSLQAFAQLRQRFPTWSAVRDAPVEQVEEAIRCGGLAAQKAPRIQQVLRAISDTVDGEPHLQFLESLSDEQAADWLMRLPGVGPKTAAIVLAFAMGRPVVPVDTHIFRVGWRLGLYPRSVGEAKAHDLLRPLVAPEDAYAYHVLVIRHGREICTARSPRCAICPLASLCPSSGVHASNVSG